MLVKTHTCKVLTGAFRPVSAEWNTYLCNQRRDKPTIYFPFIFVIFSYFIHLWRESARCFNHYVTWRESAVMLNSWCQHFLFSNVLYSGQIHIHTQEQQDGLLRESQRRLGFEPKRFRWGRFPIWFDPSARSERPNAPIQPTNSQIIKIHERTE